MHIHGTFAGMGELRWLAAIICVIDKSPKFISGVMKRHGGGSAARNRVLNNCFVIDNNHQHRRPDEKRRNGAGARE